MNVKRLYIFLLKTFLPLFAMTFVICLFIVLMQFLWKYVDEMVGKGLSVAVLGEMFFYAALSFVPMALPLAVLLASLMTFGNLGEQLELLAMKAAGISLPRIMLPLIVCIAIVALGSFYFQNNIIPPSQVKMWTLLYSMRLKAPELEIPERTFYNAIEGYSMYVREKEKNGLLRHIMIYDYTEGFDKATVTVADSGRLYMSTDKMMLVLTLYNGEAFENLKQGAAADMSPEAVPYRRESFELKEATIPYNANFDRADESMMQNRYIGKDLTALQTSIDTMTIRLDYTRAANAQELYAQSYHRHYHEQLADPADDSPTPRTPTPTTAPTKKIGNFDSLFYALPVDRRAAMLSQAKTDIEYRKMEYDFKASVLNDEAREMRRHHVEMHKKFTFSVACLIFFFIGAPLGAIIRKGGLGMPAVISVGLFIVYYIIDTIGVKMTTNGVWQPWQGMWLSTAVLLPLGIFLTYKASNDSAILNPDAYANFFRRLTGRRLARKIERKEVIIYTPDYAALSANVKALNTLCDRYEANFRRWTSYPDFWRNGGVDIEAEQIARLLEQIVDEAANSDRILLLNKLMDYPIVSGRQLARTDIAPALRKALALLLPIGIALWLVAAWRRKQLRTDIRTVRRINGELDELFDATTTNYTQS